MTPEVNYTNLFINNEWADARSGKTFDARCPHDGSVLAQIAEGDKADIDLAVGAAKAAFHRDSEWRLLDASVRGRLLNKFADLIQRDADHLAQLESYNNGMNISMALGIVQKGVNGARYAASLADKIQGDTIPADGDLFSYTLKQPVGVCGLILPWNAPILMFVNKVCTALAAVYTSRLVPLSPKSGSDDGIHEELRELLKNSRETYSDFSMFGNKPSICIQKVAFGEMELVQKTKDGHPKTGGGCTVVVKPAEQTPLTSLALAALLKEAGVPTGVVNVVTGYGPGAGTSLTHHPDVAKISFTGSLEVGKQIQQAAGKVNLKRVTLELGGKSPLVIMNDADLNLAVPWAAHGVFGNQGQMCFAASRTFVQSAIYDEFVEKAVEFAKNIKIGNPADPGVEHGPQIDGEIMNKVLSYIAKGKKEGAKLMTGGNRIGNTGYYIEPTVFADVGDHMVIAKEEIFGPVQSIFRFETLKEVIERANNTNYGLASGIFTRNINDALHFSKHVEAGNVWINTFLASTAQTPFGGFKDSGVGREKGVHCVEEYLEVKTVTISLPKKF